MPERARATRADVLARAGVSRASVPSAVFVAHRRPVVRYLVRSIVVGSVQG